MDAPRNPSSGADRRAGWKKALPICALIALAGIGATVLIFATEPKAERGGAVKKRAMLVETVGVERGDFRPTIEAMGTVRARRDIVLRPRVRGAILDRSENFTPGGFLARGEVALTIDPADYENALAQQKSELRRAKAELNIEMGRQNVARQDYKLLNETLAPEYKALVLRRPQLESAQAAVDAAEAAVAQSELELERATVEAPFDAQVLSREVNVGSQVAPGDALGRLVGLDTYWVEITVPLKKLDRLTFPGENGGSASKAEIRDRNAWPEDARRVGRLDKLIGTLNEETRLARALVDVDDPLARGEANAGKPRLILGSVVETRLQGDPLENVVRLPRRYLRSDNTVWTVEDGELRVNDVEVAFRDQNDAYIRDGLSGGARVVTTNLTTVVDGAPLRTKDAGRDPNNEDRDDEG